MQSSLTVTFEWKPLECYEENGPITGYYYRVYHDNFHYSEGTVTMDTTVLTLKCANMQAFSVAAMNVEGIGALCPPVPIPTFDRGTSVIPNFV